MFGVKTLVRSVLFPQPRAAGPLPLPDDARPYEVRAAGCRVEAVYLPPDPAHEGPRPTLVFAHGNGELIDDWLPAFDAPRTWGVGVLLVEYPGYGRSSGSPSEASIRATLVAAHDRLLEEPEVDADRVIAYGRSLGGGAVCAALRERPAAALVLESTFCSVREMAARFGLPGALVPDPFDNLGAVRGFDGPMLVVHGTRDEVIPVEHGRRLHQAGRASRFHEVDCGHNDMPRPWAKLFDFLVDADLLA